MSQNIECTECHDLISLEGGSTISLPYVCTGCQISRENQQEDEQRKKGFISQPCADPACAACHPPTTAYDNLQTLRELVANPAVEGALATQGFAVDHEAIAEVLGDGHDTATIENTTLMIEDLQTQLNNVKTDRVSLESQNIDLRAENTFLRNQLEEQSKAYATVRNDLRLSLSIATRLA